MVHGENGYAKHHKYGSGYTVERYGTCLVSQKCGKLCKSQRAYHADHKRLYVRPPIAKWLTAPVSAVALIMNTLVPTAVFNS